VPESFLTGAGTALSPGGAGWGIWAAGEPLRIHGSGSPFPANPAVFWHRLHPGTLPRLMGETNLMKRDWQLKRALGLPPEVCSRARTLLLDQDRPSSGHGIQRALAGDLFTAPVNPL
jgi:hypothetical protein